MNAGVLGIPDGRLTTIESRHVTRTDGDHEITTAVDVTEQTTLGGDTAAVEGRVLRETVEEVDTALVDDDGGIIVGSERQKVQQWADIVGMTANEGHDGFLVVGSSDAVFGFDVVGNAIIEPAEFALGEFLDEHRILGLTTAGSGAVGPIESITAHGSDVLEDEEIGVGEHIRDAIRGGYLSQVRVRYDSDHYGLVKAYIAASGYVDVYDPDLETAEFLELVSADFLPYVRGGEEA